MFVYKQTQRTSSGIVGGGGGGGGLLPLSPIATASTAATGVKMRSSDQGTMGQAGVHCKSVVFASLSHCARVSVSQRA